LFVAIVSASTLFLSCGHKTLSPGDGGVDAGADPSDSAADSSDSSIDSSTPPTCPDDASQCPSGCRPIYAAPYDPARMCLDYLNKPVVGCTDHLGGTGDAPCVKRIRDGAMFQAASGSDFRSRPDWTSCTDAESMVVVLSRSCSQADAGTAGGGTGGAGAIDAGTGGAGGCMVSSDNVSTSCVGGVATTRTGCPSSSSVSGVCPYGCKAPGIFGPFNASMLCNDAPGPDGGCDGGCNGPDGPLPATFVISLSDMTPKMELRATLKLTISIAANGYRGPVTLSTEGLPADLSVTLERITVTLTGAGTESIALMLTSPSTSTSGDSPFKVRGTADTGVVSTSATLTIQPTITFTIPPGTADMAATATAPITTLFGDYPTIVNATANLTTTPITVRFFNADSVPHNVHGDLPQYGFFHDNVGGAGVLAGAFGPDRHLISAQTYNFSLHDTGEKIRGRLVVQ
jgi:hypothetical protein